MKKLSFSLLGTLIIVLITGSAVEQFAGTAAAVKYVYTAPWTIALWAAAMICAIIYLVQQKVYKAPITFFLHLSFAVILGGAMTTHLFGEQGEIHLRLGEPQQSLSLRGSGEAAPTKTLPFTVTLTDFDITYYPGTRAPMDYTSLIQVARDGETAEGGVSMNKVFTYDRYRFYQSRYDSDSRGTTLAVNHDPWGIGMTYAGYIMLFASMLLFFFQSRTRFRALFRRMTLAAALFIALPMSAATPAPPTLNREVAKSFGEMYVYYNNRVCPMQTLAQDFTVKLYGKPKYKGLTAEQVLTGWLYEYNKWAKEPMIKIKGDEVKQALGIQGKYACLNDFVGKGQYKLDSLLRAGNKNARTADEKFQIISTIATGTALRTLPYYTADSALHWVAVSGELPEDVSYGDVQVMMGGWDYLALMVATGKDTEAIETINKIRTWQEKKAGIGNLPSARKQRLEISYNRFQYVRPLAMACAFIGIIGFIISCLLLARRRQMPQWLHIIFICLMAGVCLTITAGLAIRWAISGHVPLSNGHETMQFMAWATSLASTVASLYVLFRRKQMSLLLSAGYLVCGMTLMVSMMAGSNPQITQLMPVLQSPLLTIHVAVIMLSYCLLAFIMLNSVAAIALWTADKAKRQNTNREAIERLQLMSEIMLYPAVFLLTAGIFIGAIWANQSWGRYWGWDPKEVWALLTMLVYAIGLHTGSLGFLKRPMVYHAYMLFAFLFVLFTYFGVNFILGGMHSYA